MAIDECDCGRLAVGKLISEAEAEMRACHAEFVLAHFVEDASAVAENDGDAGDGVPDDVAKPRRPVKGTAMASQSVWRAASSGVPMVMRRWADCGIEPE